MTSIEEQRRKRDERRNRVSQYPQSKTDSTRPSLTRPRRLPRAKEWETECIYRGDEIGILYTTCKTVHPPVYACHHGVANLDKCACVRKFPKKRATEVVKTDGDVLPIVGDVRESVSECASCEYRRHVDASQVTICVTSWKRPESEKRLLESIEKWLPGIKVVVKDTGGNVSAARNWLADNCETPYMLVMEEDFECIAATVAYLEEAIAIMDENDDISAVGGSPLCPRKKQWWAHDVHTGNGECWFSQSTRTRSLLGKDRVACHVIMMFGLFRTEMIKTVRFNEDIPTKGEHWEFFVRSFRAGHQCTHLDEWEINHYEDRPNDEYNNARNTSYFRIAEQSIGLKWKGNSKLTPNGNGPNLNGNQTVRRINVPTSSDWPSLISPMLQPLTEKPDIIIFGVGHSGTSVATAFVHALGWNCSGTSEDMEDIPVRNANIALLSGHDPGDTKRMIEEMPQPWVLKDPKFVKTLSYWIRIFRTQRRHPVLVWIHRDESAIKASWKNRLGVKYKASVVSDLMNHAQTSYDAWPWHKITIQYEDLVRAASVVQIPSDMDT